MRPTDVIAQRRVLLERSREVVRQHKEEGESGYSDDDPEGAAQEILIALDDDDCKAYLVTSDMTAVALTAARTMPSQPLREDDLPSPSGILFFDSPVASYPFADTPAQIVGAVWAGYGYATCLPDDPDEEANGPGGVDVAVTPLAVMPGSVQVFPVPPIYWQVSYESDTYPDGEMFLAPPADDVPNDRAGVGPVLLATWTIMQQTLAALEPSLADRAERRRCARAGLPSDLVLVQLRKRRGRDESEGEQGVEWSHRWMVDGHWRNQWLPSRSCHRLQWIAAHLKGPEGKPLMLKERVYVWSR